MKYSTASTTSCGTYTYGEVEDYTASITGGSGFAPTSLLATEGLTSNNPGKNMLSVYPNPVAHINANISYNLAKEGNTTIKVIDMVGRNAQVASFGRQPAGLHNFVLTTQSKLNNGTYLIILVQDGQIISRSKLVVAK